MLASGTTVRSINLSLALIPASGTIALVDVQAIISIMREKNMLSTITTF